MTPWDYYPFLPVGILRTLHLLKSWVFFKSRDFMILLQTHTQQVNPDSPKSRNYHDKKAVSFQPTRVLNPSRSLTLRGCLAVFFFTFFTLLQHAVRTAGI